MKDLITDAGKALLSGVIFGSLFGGVLFLIGRGTGGSVSNGLEVCKNGMLLVSALAWIVVAGMLITKGKKERTDAGTGWRKQFRKLGYQSVILLFSLPLVLLAAWMDQLIRTL